MDFGKVLIIGYVLCAVTCGILNAIVRILHNRGWIFPPEENLKDKYSSSNALVSFVATIVYALISFSPVLLFLMVSFLVRVLRLNRKRLATRGDS